MRTRALRIVLLLLASSAVPATAGLEPRPVSPRGAAGSVTIDSRCPLFVWSTTAAARGYELRVRQRSAAAERPRPVLSRRLPAGAGAWQPTLVDCLERGRSYDWAVRSLPAGAWSAAALFSIAPAPTAAELRRALELAELVSPGGDEAVRREGDIASEGAARGASHVAAEGATHRGGEIASEGVAAGELDTTRPTTPSSGAPSVSPSAGDETVLLAALPDGPGVGVGVHGRSGSGVASSAGIAGTSTALSGDVAGVAGETASVEGAAGVFEGLAGADLIRGERGGLLRFEVDAGGTVTAAVYQGDGSGLTGVVAAAGGSLTGSYPNPAIAPNAVGSAEIFDNSILAEDLAEGSVTSVKIAADAVGPEELATNSVEADDIAEDAVRDIHIKGGGVTGLDIDGRAIGGDHLLDISAVWVDCNGNCTDVTLGQACDAADPLALEPIAISCGGSPASSQMLQCGEDNFCSGKEVAGGTRASEYCPEKTGFDLLVFCLRN